MPKLLKRLHGGVIWRVLGVLCRVLMGESTSLSRDKGGGRPEAHPGV